MNPCFLINTLKRHYICKCEVSVCPGGGLNNKNDDYSRRPPSVSC